jgi:cyclophilin family peptidyl-prolyl cis-trans isomerase
VKLTGVILSSFYCVHGFHLKNWSPNGYDRAVELFQRHFYDGSHFFRVVPGFLTQFGISYSNDSVLQSFARRQISDDPKKTNPEIPFEPGIISFAGSGPNSRTSQLFISYGSAKSLGTQPWETPIGKVIDGMDSTVKKFHSYGDIPPFGEGPQRK